MNGRLRVVAFELDSPSLLSLREALPGWDIEVVDGGTAASLTQDSTPAPADLLVVGTRNHFSETLGLCRGLRNQAGHAGIPILVLVAPDQQAQVTAVLKAGANGCLVLPIHSKTLASSVARAREGNQPGRHTRNVDQAQVEDDWRDDGGQG